MHTCLVHIGHSLFEQNLLAKSFRVRGLGLSLAAAYESESSILSSRLSYFVNQIALGYWQEAEANWRLFDPRGHGYSRAMSWFVGMQFYQGHVQDTQFEVALTLAEENRDRHTIRVVHRLRGFWLLDQGDWVQAAKSLAQATEMARERRLEDNSSETGLILAKPHLGQFTEADARQEAKRLFDLQGNPRQLLTVHRFLAMLWLNLGDFAQAKKCALAYYTKSWADGEPYVYRYHLTKAAELLKQMSVPVPVLPPYDPAKDEPFPWEADTRAAIEKLCLEKEAKKKKKQQKLD
ncbi:MAG: hypothetical protein OEY77_05495 [Nitrospira sp.]|nr:hypothetical protein [Nitrospira sp.]